MLHVFHILPSKLSIKYTSFLSFLPFIFVFVMQTRTTTTCPDAWLLWMSYLHFPPFGQVWKLNMSTLTTTGKCISLTWLPALLLIFTLLLLPFSTKPKYKQRMFLVLGLRMETQELWILSLDHHCFFKIDQGKSVHVSRVHYLLQCHMLPST